MKSITLQITVTLRPSLFTADALEATPQRYLDSAAMVAAKRIWEWFEPDNVLSIEATTTHDGLQGKARVQG